MYYGGQRNYHIGKRKKRRSNIYRYTKNAKKALEKKYLEVCNLFKNIFLTFYTSMIVYITTKKITKKKINYREEFHKICNNILDMPNKLKTSLEKFEDYCIEVLIKALEETNLGKPKIIRKFFCLDDEVMKPSTYVKEWRKDNLKDWH